MQRRSWLLLLVPAMLFAAACSNDAAPMPSEPGMPSIPVNANRIVPSGCTVITARQIGDLFAPKQQLIVTAWYVLTLADIAAGRTTQAVTHMYQIWDFTLKNYYAGKLDGGQSTDTQTAVLAFGQQLYCLVGLDGSTLTLSTTPLDQNNVVQVVYPSSSDQTVVTGTQEGGLLIPANTLTQPVTISITLLPGPYTFPAGPLNTKLDQYGPFYEFTVVPAQTFTTPVIAAGCIAAADGGTPPPSVDIAHNVGNGIEILPTAPVGFLNCTGTGMAPHRSLFQLVEDKHFGQAVKRLGSLAVNLVSPRALYAVGSGIGGKTKSFSPFGGVDTAVVVKSASSTTQNAPAGSDVASAPSVVVQTATGTPLGGASVTFAITSGGGSLGPATSSSVVPSTTATSDNTTGLATVPNWTLGVGPTNTATANAAITLPATLSGFPTTGAGITISGNPVTFTATSNTDLIPYQAPGYSYQSGTTGFDTGFEAPSFDASGWPTGPAAFGSSNLGSSCPSLVASVGTTWPNNPNGSTDMLLRKSFTLPAWWTAGLTVGIAIDNDFQLFVDGVNVTPTSNPAYDPSSGFVKHEGCATQDSFLVPLTVAVGTQSTQHLLAIRARDRGVAAYVDSRLSVSPPPAP